MTPARRAAEYTEAERLAIVESELDNLASRIESMDNRQWYILIGVVFSILSPVLVHVVAGK